MRNSLTESRWFNGISLLMSLGTLVGGTPSLLAAPTLTTLVSFNGSNGYEPAGSLLADSAGNLYGTTTRGGANNYGSVFKLNIQTQLLTTLVSFNYTNGFSPQGSLY